MNLRFMKAPLMEHYGDFAGPWGSAPDPANLIWGSTPHAG